MARRPRPHEHLADLLAETRRLARRNRRKLDPHVLAEITVLQAEAKSALAAKDDARIARVTALLEGAGTKHLEPLRRSFVREALEMIAVAVLLAVCVRLFVVEAYRIPSSSMVPTLVPGDVVVVNKSAYGVHLPDGTELIPGPRPKYGDLIVFRSPRQAGEDLIKRVAGLPGDTIEIVDEQLRVNGLPQPRVAVADRFEFWGYRDDLRYWHPQSGNLYLEEQGGRRYATVHARLLPRPRPSEGPFIVPEGHLFVLGDNRDDSDDGRAEGGWYVPFDAVKGRAWLVGFSWGREGLAPWGGEDGVRVERLLRQVDGGVPQPDELPLEEAAALMRAELAGRGVIESAPADGPQVEPVLPPAPQRKRPSRDEGPPSRPAESTATVP